MEQRGLHSNAYSRPSLSSFMKSKHSCPLAFVFLQKSLTQSQICQPTAIHFIPSNSNTLRPLTLNCMFWHILSTGCNSQRLESVLCEYMPGYTAFLHASLHALVLVWHLLGKSRYASSIKVAQEAARRHLLAVDVGVVKAGEAGLVVGVHD